MFETDLSVLLFCTINSKCPNPTVALFLEFAFTVQEVKEASDTTSAEYEVCYTSRLYTVQ